jgi:hypothetical protein
MGAQQSVSREAAKQHTFFQELPKGPMKLENSHEAGERSRSLGSTFVSRMWTTGTDDSHR